MEKNILYILYNKCGIVFTTFTPFFVENIVYVSIKSKYIFCDSDMGPKE